MMGQVAYVGASGGEILGKMMQAGCALMLAAPAWADVITCDMDDGNALAFEIDRNQFVDAISADEPPRRKVTLVQYGPETFSAEPLLIGDLRGFEAQGNGGATTVFVMQPDGTARLTNQQDGLRVDGFCEVTD